MRLGGRCPDPARAAGRRRAAGGAQAHRVRDERRPSRRRRLRAQAVAAGLPGLAGGGRDGRRRAAARPRRVRAPHRVRRRGARRAPPRPRRRAADPQRLRPRRARRRGRRGGPRRLRLRRAARGDPGGPPRRVAPLRRTRSHVPDAGRPLARRGSGRRRDRGRNRRDGRERRQAGAAAARHGARPPRSRPRVDGRRPPRQRRCGGPRGRAGLRDRAYGRDERRRGARGRSGAHARRRDPRRPGPRRPMTAASRSIALLVNPNAAGGRTLRLLPRVETRLRALGVAVHTRRTNSLLHGCELARAAAARGDVPVTLGGDGLVGAVAGALRDVPEAVLGVLPGGRGNDFARMLGLPLDATAACDVLASGVARPVDVGDAGGRTFVGIASLGFDSDANRIANAAPARLGRLAYVYGALRALAGWRPARFVVEVDGVRRELRGWSVAAANSAFYGGGMRLAPHARLDDGALDVILVGECSRARFVRTLPKVFRGGHVREPNVAELRGAEVRVDADRPFTVFADGDPVGHLPITLRAVPGALRVLLPA